MQALKDDKFTQFQSELSFYEGQLLGLHVASSARGNIEVIQEALKHQSEYDYEGNLQDLPVIPLNWEMVKKGYTSGLWLGMGHTIYPEPQFDGIGSNLVLQCWTTAALLEGLRFAAQNNFSQVVLHQELEDNEIRLLNVDQNPAMKSGTSPRIYQEGFRRGLMRAITLLK